MARVWDSGAIKLLGQPQGALHRLRPFNHLALWPKFISALRRLLLSLLLFNTNPNAIVVVAINKTREGVFVCVCVWGALYINLDNKQLGYLFFLILTSTFSAHVARTVEPEAAPHRQRDRRTDTDTDVDKVIYTQTTHTHTASTRGVFVAILQAMRGVQLNHINSARIYNCLCERVCLCLCMCVCELGYLCWRLST